MVKISKQVDYGIQFLMRLALDTKSTISLREFSIEHNISFLFMQKIVKKLREAKLVESYRGASGGYMLSRNPETLSLIEIMESIEGPYMISECTNKGIVCVKISTCTAKKPLHGIQTQITSYLQQTTLKSLLQ